MLSFLKNILVVPTQIPSDEARYFSLGNMASMSGFIGHLILLLSFVYFHIWQMALINVGSLAIFAFCFFVNRKSKYTLTISLSCIEVILHAVIAVLLMGWQSGFYYYLSILFLVVFLQKKKYDHFALLISGLIIIIYIGLFAYCTWIGKAILDIEEGVNHFYYLNNMIITSLIIALGGFYYKSTANDVENKLDNAYKKITSSIRYAQRIQESILPKNEILAANCSEHFIWYQPKDMVSGDFYWFIKIENKLLVAAIDCTGHGVPGAFMTMLAKVLLKNIVQEQKCTSPALILEKLHEQVVEILRQEEGLSQDGMDMSLICINFDEKTVSFAGAMNAIFYIKKQEIVEIKATKHPIGGIQKNRKLVPFEENVLPISPEMKIYLFSDGVTDQFKENESKKFGKKRLKEFLEQHQHLSMDEQGKMLAKLINDWTGKSKQIDDIVVIGLKI